MSLFLVKYLILSLLTILTHGSGVKYDPTKMHSSGTVSLYPSRVINDLLFIFICSSLTITFSFVKKKKSFSRATTRFIFTSDPYIYVTKSPISISSKSKSTRASIVLLGYILGIKQLPLMSTLIHLTHHCP